MAERRDVIRNRKAILQGYIDMTSKKVIDKITVSDVIKESNVSRATFYAHYKDIGALKSQFEDDFMQMMIQLNASAIDHMLSDPFPSVLNFLTTFDKNKKMIRAISGDGSSESFFLLFKNVLKKELLKRMPIANNETDAEVVAFCISNLIIDNCREIVLEKRKKISLQDRATIVSRFIPKKRK